VGYEQTIYQENVERIIDSVGDEQNGNLSIFWNENTWTFPQPIKSNKTLELRPRTQ
jgi:hypothetical protein